MRIWDLNPGYLNRQSLLGEHRELHGIVSILVHGKKGYANHPETQRWLGYGWALRQRHRALACEMELRGYTDNSPVRTRAKKGRWPEHYIDAPEVQFRLLEQKYAGKDQGRIPIPKNTQALWRQHKYSVLARDPARYREIGRLIADREIDFDRLSKLLIDILRTPPSKGGIKNAVQHMWGHVSDHGKDDKSEVESWSLRRLLSNTQQRAMASKEPYLLGSTALSELMAWI